PQPGRYALSGTAVAPGCPGPLLGHARGDVWTGRRCHESALRRRSRGADERQLLRPYRGGLDARRGRGRDARRAGADRHLVHESLRLSGPGPRLGWRQGFGAWLYALGGRIRASDTAKIIPPAGKYVSAIVKANW